jgi:hypothetical protein
VSTPPQRPPGPPGRHGPRRPPPEPPTQRLRRPAHQEAPTEQLRAPRQPVEAATERIRQAPREPEKRPAKRLRRGQSALLAAIIVVALVVCALAGAELYARHRAGTLLADVTQCVVQDGATISFGVNPPFLWQYLTGHYTNLSVDTAGNQVQAAKGMTADVTLRDIRLQRSGDSQGTIGDLNATLTWTAEGIKGTVVDNLPVVGALVTEVRTDAGAGTLTMTAAGGTSVTAQPVVTDGALGLRVLDVSGPFDKDTVQSALDGLTKKLDDNYPLGIHADSVTVTDTGVVGKFSSQNASIPNGESDSCFAGL